MPNLKNLTVGGAECGAAGAELGLAILRIFRGLSMAFSHGLGKIPPSSGFLEGVAKMGFPAPGLFAWSAGISEFGGGILLALGLLTRPASFFIGCTMLVAAFLRHAADPYGRKERALLYLAVAVAYLLVGAGRYSVDSWIRSRSRRAAE